MMNCSACSATHSLSSLPAHHPPPPPCPRPEDSLSLLSLLCGCRVHGAVGPNSSNTRQQRERFSFNPLLLFPLHCELYYLINFLRFPPPYRGSALDRPGQGRSQWGGGYDSVRWWSAREFIFESAVHSRWHCLLHVKL